MDEAAEGSAVACPGEDTEEAATVAVGEGTLHTKTLLSLCADLDLDLDLESLP